MSGQPYRYASDPAKFRDEYMKTIRLQSDINTMNLDANKAFKATGQLPAVSQMPETRTTSEILADQQKIRMSLMEDLKTIGSPAFTSDIIQAIQRSPLNIDGSLFIFFAQRAPEIVTNVKKQYKYGIKGDKNDVAQFVFFVEDMYNKTKSFSSSVKTYFNRPVEGQLGVGVITFGDLESIKKLYEEVTKKLLLAKSAFPTVREYNEHREVITQVSTMFDELASTLKNADYVANTRTFIESNTKLIQYPGYIDVIDNYSDLYKRYNEILENFPKASTLYSLIRKLDESAKNQNYELMEQIIMSIIQQLEPGTGGFKEFNRRLETARTELNELLQYEQVEHPKELREEERERRYQEMIRRGEEQDRERGEQWDLSGITPTREPVNVEDLTLLTQEAVEQPSVEKTQKEIVRESRLAKLGFKTKSEKEKEIEDIGERLKTLNHMQGFYMKEASKYPEDSSLHRTYMKRHETNLTEAKQLEDRLKELQGSKEGSGIKKRGRGRPRGSGVGTAKTFKDSFLKHKDDTVGIDESPRYVKFGRYFLNTHKLKGTGMLTLRRQGGGNISELPSSRVSTNLSDIVFKMVGGGVPTYQELSKLSEPEKAYLHKISTKANIIDKFSIPAPDKDRAEKDIHDFEVMKGEILAGNDSKELIKKFKLHLIKLSKNGTLPKGEVQEIMEELIQLGF